MKIVKATIYEVRFPLHEQFIISYATYPDMPSIILKLETDIGLIGYGEAVPEEHLTGEYFSTTYELLKELLIPLVIGENPFNIESIHHKMNAAIDRNPAAKAAIDIACYDLAGKALGTPIYNLLGGKAHTTLTYPKVLSIEVPEFMAERLVKEKEDWDGSLQLKVGLHNPQTDIDRLRDARSAVEFDMPSYVDTEEVWEIPSFVESGIRELFEEDDSWDEQPIRRGDIRGLAEIRSKTAIPIMTDESILQTEENVIQIKLMKCGGIFQAIQLAKVAEAAGVTCHIGSMVESSIGSAAGYHAAMAQCNIESTELTGPLLFKEEVGNLTYKFPEVLLADKPGLGVNVDNEKLRKLTVKSDVIT